MRMVDDAPYYNIGPDYIRELICTYIYDYSDNSDSYADDACPPWEDDEDDKDYEPEKGGEVEGKEEGGEDLGSEKLPKDSGQVVLRPTVGLAKVPVLEVEDEKTLEFYEKVLKVPRLALRECPGAAVQLFYICSP